MFSSVILFYRCSLLNEVSDFVSAFVHKMYTKLSNVIQNATFIVFDVYSVQPVLSGHSSHSPRVAD